MSKIIDIDFSKWVDAGYPVFPVVGKKPHGLALPRTDDGGTTWLPFTERLPTEDELINWEKLSDITGVAVPTGRLSGIIGLDYDCFNDYPEILAIIPESPIVRIGLAPKWMRFYRYDPHFPSEKIKLKLVDGVQDGIELLTDGRYFVADGIHKDTKEPYFYTIEHFLNIDKHDLPFLPRTTWDDIKYLAKKYDSGDTIDKSYMASGGRHDDLLKLCGQLIAAKVSDENIIDQLEKRDAEYSESYFKSHRNTSPEKMLMSIKKTRKRKEKKLKASTAIIPELVEKLPQANEVTVSSEDSTPAPSSKEIALLVSMGVAVNKHGKPITNQSNILKILLNWKSLHKDFIWFDEFYRTYLTKGLTGTEEEAVWNENTHLLELLIKLQDQLKLHGLSKKLLEDAIIAYAHRNKKNAVVDYLNSLEWDKVPRINNFLHECFGAADNQYTRYASKNMWIGMIARAVEPGCKLDTMIVLEGGQGAKKGSAFRAMVGEKWFAESSLSPSNKDFYVCMQGKLLVEIAELEAFDKAEVTEIKRMLSCNVDRYRAPYGKIAQDWPRQGIFVGSTNETEYLRDTTGNRRFWPVSVGDIDQTTIAFYKDMYFAESYERFKNGEDWYRMPASDTAKEQEARLQQDAWQDSIESYLMGRTTVTNADVAMNALDIKLQDINRSVENRIGACLRRAKWHNPLVWDADKQKMIRKWVKKPIDV